MRAHKFLQAQTMTVGIEFVLYMVDMARFLVVFLKFRKSQYFGENCKGNEPCTSYSRKLYDTQMATANCVHPHAQLEHA